MSKIETAQLDEWKAAIGRRTVARQILEIESLRRYALAVGSDPAVEDVHPPLPHWAFFLPMARDDEIGGDGHPRRGGFLPPITLPRRMFAASRIDFETPLELGTLAEMTSTVANVAHKSGRSGELLFVEVERSLLQGGTLRVRERQSYVYRDAGAPISMPVPAAQAPEGELWHPDEVNLFRFSATTFNSHRIHYDLPYATGVENYPALVVHGPLIAAKLAGLASRDGTLASFAFRAQAPLFLGQPIRLRKGDGEVSAVRCDGITAMIAKAGLR
jgi:3-methylfumaryl-CoA hydratase